MVVTRKKLNFVHLMGILCPYENGVLFKLLMFFRCCSTLLRAGWTISDLRIERREAEKR